MLSLQKELLLGIFSIIICIVLVVFYTLEYNNINIASESLTKQSSSQSQAAKSQSDSATKLSLEEVARHTKESDCWIVISNTVYVVTDYLTLHPGGAQRIIPYCGQDATSAFATQGGQGSHSQNAYNDLAKLAIGKLNETTTVDMKRVQQAAQTIPVRKGEEEE